MNVDALLGRADRWLDVDPDPVDVAALRRLRNAAAAGDADATAELADAFGSAVTFGTAGIRGRLGAGPNRINELVAAYTAAGLGDWLAGHAAGGTVVVGFDAREGSSRLARRVAATLTASGFDVRSFASPVPTPLVAFAVRDLDAAAGVMVTASHNPATDNGIKVYVADGSQVNAPDDAAIETHIARRRTAGTVPPVAASWSTVDAAVRARYETRAVSLVDVSGDRDRGTARAALRAVYTPLHGVGGDVFTRVAAAAGFDGLVVNGAELLPDPRFGGVAFPNPEERGVLEPTFALAASVDAHVVVAHDPDADRVAVGVPVDGPGGRTWRRLTGDEVGALLYWWLVRIGRRPQVCASSVVSGGLLAAMVAADGGSHVTTLTGFKWLARAGAAYAYEEALGYCVDPHVVGDKDGISAALLVLDCAAVLAASGSTIVDVLAGFDVRYGAYRTAQVSVPAADLTGVQLPAPGATAGSFTVVDVAGLAVTETAAAGDGMVLRRTAGNVWALTAAGLSSARVIVRPSGTEAKVKAYLQCVAPNAGRADEALAELVELVAGRAADAGGPAVRGDGVTS